MIAITFTDLAEAAALVEQINAYVGSTAIVDPVPSDSGAVVLVPQVARADGVLDLPSMMVGKVFTPPPTVAPLVIVPQTIDTGSTIA